MKYQWIIPLGAAIGNLVLSVIVLSRDRRPLHVAFAFLTGALVLWNLDIFGLYFFDSPEFVFKWARVFRVGPIIAPASTIAFLYVFAERTERWRRWGLWLSVLLSVVLLTANALDLLVTDVQRLGWGYYPVGSGLYHLLTLNFLIALGYAAIALPLELRQSESPRKRLQVRLLLFATAVALPLGLTNLLPAYGIRVYPLGNLANVVYVGVVAYGIVRHRLMDIDLVVTKGMAYAAVSFVLIVPVFLATLWLQRVSFGHIQPEFSFIVVLMFVAVGVLFPTLRLRAESRIERSLFAEKHQYRQILVAFTHSIVRILDREKLVRELAGTLSESLQLDRIAIALGDDAKRAFVIQYALGLPPTSSEFSDDHEFIAWLRRRQESVLRDELEGSGDPTERAGAAEICRVNGWEVCVPLTVGGSLIGFIGLGRKRNLDAFFAEDLDLLGTLAAEASVALENARLYEELKRSQDIIRRADRLSALGTLAAGIAHEVRNPLVSIQTFFQLAPDRLHDEEFFTTFLSMTANEVKRISDLISELLSFARSPTRSLGPVNLNEVAERVVTLLEPEARKHKLDLPRALSPSVPIVRADADQVKQVLINLVLNAIQATHPGGQVSVTTRSVQRGTTTFGQIEIRDTGIGIPKDQLDDIFNPFFTTKDKGTGLGLAIAHQIVMEHGGFVSVDSTEGEGTSFCVDLPAYEGGVSAQEEPAEVDVLPGRYGRLRKVAS